VLWDALIRFEARRGFARVGSASRPADIEDLLCVLVALIHPGSAGGWVRWRTALGVLSESRCKRSRALSAAASSGIVVRFFEPRS
jgi:hypothetical protein